MHHLLPVVGLQPVIIIAFFVAMPGFNTGALLRDWRLHIRDGHSLSLAGGEFECRAIHAVAQARGIRPIGKHMAQMPVAFRAAHLGAG